jgi:hypothetical protein
MLFYGFLASQEQVCTCFLVTGNLLKSVKGNQQSALLSSNTPRRMMLIYSTTSAVSSEVTQMTLIAS